MVDEKNIVLLLEVLRHKEIVGRKRLQKIICILKYKYNISFSFNYIPYFYGPYSDELADVIQSLVATGLVNEEVERLNDEIIQYKYSLTKKGEEFVNVLEHKCKDIVDKNKFIEYLEDINNKSTPELVKMSKESFNNA